MPDDYEPTRDELEAVMQAVEMTIDLSRRIAARMQFEGLDQGVIALEGQLRTLVTAVPKNLLPQFAYGVALGAAR